MGQTLLTHIHNNCGGSIVLSVGNSAKFIAPSFSIGIHGIQSILMDIQLPPTGFIDPEWECARCHTIIDKNDMPEHVACNCQVCGKRFKIAEIEVQEHISTVCLTCLAGLKKAKKSPEGLSDRIIEYANYFNIGERARTNPLITVLTTKIPLK